MLPAPPFVAALFLLRIRSFSEQHSPTQRSTPGVLFAPPSWKQTLIFHLSPSSICYFKNSLLFHYSEKQFAVSTNLPCKTYFVVPRASIRQHMQFFIPWKTYPIKTILNSSTFQTPFQSIAIYAFIMHSQTECEIAALNQRRREKHTFSVRKASVYQTVLTIIKSFSTSVNIVVNKPAE